MAGLCVDFDKVCQTIHLLVEGMGIRAISRFTKLDQKTVLKILETAGQKAANFLDAKIRNVNADFVQADEIHTFVYSKQQNTPEHETLRGEQFTFLSVDRRSKLIINWLVGKRTLENAEYFMMDLRSRVNGRFQLTTDNWTPYSGRDSGAVASVFGCDVDYATETKTYARPAPYLPQKVIAIKRKSRIGQPDLNMATTCHVERTNLSVRIFTKRFTRCTLGYLNQQSNAP